MKAVRERKGVTQAELAERVGVTVRAVRKWESLGIGHATFANAVKAADALGCSLDELAAGVAATD